jgi:FkbM family methyltransferase
MQAWSLKIYSAKKGCILRFKRWDPVELMAKHDVRRNPLIHVGAHFGEELELYRELGYTTTLWVEAQPHAFQILKSRVGELYCQQAAVWDESGLEMEFNQTNNSVSSGFFELFQNENWQKEVSIERKIVIKTTTLAQVVKRFEENGVLGERFVLRLDVQGSEYRALRSSLSLLKRIDYICCEVTRGENAYRNAEKRWKIVFLLLTQKWVPLFNRINPVNSHGETIFLPLTQVPKFVLPCIYMRIVALLDTTRYHLRNLLNTLKRSQV